MPAEVPALCETWRWVFREGIAPELPDAGLRALRDACRADSPCLVQLETVLPAAVAFRHAEPEAACPLGFALWQGGGLDSVEAVWEASGRLLERAALHI